MARSWTLSFRDGESDVEVALTEQQARQLMAGQAIAYWSSTPEEIGLDAGTGRLRERHDGRDQIQEDDAA